MSPIRRLRGHGPRNAVVALTLVLGTLAARTSGAQEIAGKTELALSVGLISFSSATTKIDGAGAEEQDRSNTGFGTMESGTVFLGYGLSDSIVVGAGLSASYEKNSSEDTDDVTSTELAFTPTLKYLFPGAAVRPFASLGVGLALLGADDGTNEVSTTAFGLIGGFGISWFAAEALTLSPSISLGYVSGSASADSEGSTIGEADTNGFVVSVDMALAGWL